MKKLIVFLVCSICIQSCNFRRLFPPDQSDQYIVANESDYLIKVSTFLGGKEVESFDIERDSSVFRLDSGIETGSGLNSFFHYSPDSIWIDFDDKRRLIQNCTRISTGGEACRNVPKNIALMKFSGGIRKPENKTIDGELILVSYTVTFDNSDYERAVEL